jgi:hypothetical protein
MKILFSIVAVLLLAAPARGGTFDCQWLFRDAGSNVLSIKQVYIQPIAPYGADAGLTIISGDRKSYQSDGAGSVIVSNLFNGRSYRVEIQGPNFKTTFTNSFDTNVTGLVNGADPAYLTAPIRDGNATAYSQAQADGRFHKKAGDTSTNAIFRGTLKIPAGATVGHVFTATNADGSGAWTPNRAITNGYTEVASLPGGLAAGGAEFTGNIILPGANSSINGIGTFALANGNFTGDSLGNLTAPSFTGAVFGNATTATTANKALDIVDPLNGRTNTAALTSVGVSNNVYGDFSINRAGMTLGVDSYGGNFRMIPGSGGNYMWHQSGAGLFVDIFGDNNYYMMLLGNANFPGLQMNKYGKANENNNLLFAEVNVTSIGTYGGSGGALTGLPIEPSANAEALDYPPTVVTSWNNNLTDTLSQTNVWEQLRNVSTNGLLYAYTNQGVPFWYHIDGNTYFVTNTRINGDLAINSDTFPMSTNFLRYWQTNGFKFALTAYAHPTPSREIYVTDTGLPATAGEDGSTPAVTPATMADDVRTFYQWGIDMFRGSDIVYDTGYQRYWVLELANAIINPKGVTFADYWKFPYPRGGAKYRPMAFLWLTPRIGGTDPITYSQANVVNHDMRDFADGNGAWVGDVDSPDTVIDSMNLFRSIQTNEVPHLSKGHYGTGVSFFTDALSTNLARWQLTPALMQWGVIYISTPTNTQLSANMPIVITQLTNSEFVSLRKDVTDKCYRLFDTGISNTSAWARRLANNDYLVFVANESNATARVTFTWNQLGVPDYQYYYVRDVWNQTNMSAYNQSLTLTLPAKSLYLLRLSPCEVAEGSWSTVAGINSGDFLRITTGNVISGPSWEAGMMTSAGLAASGYVTVPSWVTNVTLEAQVTASIPMTWTNTYIPMLKTLGGRVYDTGGVMTFTQTNEISANYAVSNWSVSVNYPVTNCHKGFRFTMGTASSSCVRAYGESLRFIYR